MQSYTCPNCGAPVKMDDHGAFLECPYCGSQFKPDDSLSDEPSSRQTDSDDDNEELRTYAEIVNRHIPEFSVTEFIDRAKHILERTLDFLGDHGMYIQVGVVLLFVALAIVSFFLQLIHVLSMGRCRPVFFLCPAASGPSPFRNGSPCALPPKHKWRSPDQAAFRCAGERHLLLWGLCGGWRSSVESAFRPAAPSL